MPLPIDRVPLTDRRLRRFAAAFGMLACVSAAMEGGRPWRGRPAAAPIEARALMLGLAADGGDATLDFVPIAAPRVRIQTSGAGDAVGEGEPSQAAPEPRPIPFRAVPSLPAPATRAPVQAGTAKPAVAPPDERQDDTANLRIEPIASSADDAPSARPRRPAASAAPVQPAPSVARAVPAVPAVPALPIATRMPATDARAPTPSDPISRAPRTASAEAPLLEFTPEAAPAAPAPSAPSASVPRPPARPARPVSPAEAGSPWPVQQPANRPVRRDPTVSEASAGQAFTLADIGQATPGMDAGGDRARLVRQLIARAVDAAATRSPQIHQSFAEWQAALYDVEEVEGQRWPQLDVSGQTRALQIGGGKNATSTTTSWGNMTLSMSTSLFDWGRLRKSIEGRNKLAIAAQQRYFQAREDSAFEVYAQVVELGKYRLIRADSDQYVSRMQELVDMLSQITQVDKGRSSELTQARARLLQAEAARDNAASRVRDIELQLKKLAGYDDFALPPFKDWSLIPMQLPLAIDALPAHPSLIQAEAEADSAQLVAEAVRAGQRPQLNWVVTMNTVRDEFGRNAPLQTSLSFNWGAFRGFAGVAAEKAALERAAAGRQKRDKMQLDLEFRLRAATQDADTLRRRAQSYRDLTAETDRVRKMFFDQWYHLGRRTLLDVLSAENEYYSNRVNETTSLYDGYQAAGRVWFGAGKLNDWLAQSLGQEKPAQ